MNRFRLSSTEGTSGNATENTVYYLSGTGAENKRPNIISRPKTKTTTAIPTPIQIAQQPQQQQQQFILTSVAEHQAVQVPTTAASTSSTAMNNPGDGQVVAEGENPVCVPIQILDEAASAEFLRANNAGNHQFVTDASGNMTIETDDGNVMVILQNDDEDGATTTGTIAFGHDISNADADTQIIQGIEFAEDGMEVPTIEYDGDGELTETTSYILVQVDDQGNNILVPASAFSNQVNGIPQVTTVRTTQHQSYNQTPISVVRTTQQQQQLQQQQAQQQQQQQANALPPQEKGKPFRYVLPESEEGNLKMDDPSQYILNVLPGPSQLVYTSTATSEPPPPRAKAPPKPRKPRAKKVVQVTAAPVATSTPLPVKPPTPAPKMNVTVVSQVNVTTTPTSAVTTPVRPAGSMPALMPTPTTIAAAPAPDKSTTPAAPAVPERNLIVVKLDPVSGLTETMEPDEALNASNSAGNTDGSGGTVAAALGKAVSTAAGPAAPAATTALGTGTSKQIIVVGPKPSTSKDSVNGAPKKPAEEIVVTAFGTFKCTFCFKESTVRSHLVNHINRIHKGEKPFKCKVCNIGFQYSSSLKVHEKNHTVEKPFKCEYCECAFATDSNRNLHQKTVHLVPKDSSTLTSTTPKLKFECATCKKAYCSKYNLLCHRLTHVDDFTKPILCDFCKKECKTKAMLVNHVQTHKDAVGPFSCHVCDMSFNTESRLEAHKYMHKDKKKIYIKVEPVVENKQTPKPAKVNLAGRRNMKISTPTPRKKKEKALPTKEVFCSLCDDIFPNAEALEAHREKKHGPGSAARTYSKRDSDQYESYLGKSFAKKLHDEKEKEEKAGPSKDPTKKGTPGRKRKLSTTAPSKESPEKTEEEEDDEEEEEVVPVKRGPGRPKRTETKPVAKRGRPGRKPGPAALAKKTIKPTGGKRGRPGKKRGRKPKKIIMDESSDEESEDEDAFVPEKKTPVQVKESPKDKVAKPIKKRPIRTDPDPVSEPSSSHETTPPPEDLNDSNVRKSGRKRGKNPYLEELKRNREKKLKARQRKEKESLKRGVDGTEESTPAKRKKTVPVSPKKLEKVTPSPKKEEEETKPLVGSSRGGRKRKVTEVVVAAAIPKKRPFPKEIQELIAASNETSATNPQESGNETGKDAGNSESGETNKPKLEGEIKKEETDSTENKASMVNSSGENTTKKEGSPIKSEAEVDATGTDESQGKSNDSEEQGTSEKGTGGGDPDGEEAGPSKATEDSDPPSNTSEGPEDGQGEDGRVETSIPMKKRKVIKAERDKELDKNEMGKSFFKLFKQVKKDYVSSM